MQAVRIGGMALSRPVVAFFLLGTLNNLTFVVNNAGAQQILPGNVGVIYIINCLPELLVKATAPFWWHLFTYRAKIVFAGACFAANMLLVNAGLGLPVGMRLLGVALSDLGGGLGEASHLALSQVYTDPRSQLSAWSSGTGAAGVVGYLLSIYVLPHLQTAGRLLLAGTVLGSYWLSFFVLLPPPSAAAGCLLPRRTATPCEALPAEVVVKRQLSSYLLSQICLSLPSGRRCAEGLHTYSLTYSLTDLIIAGEEEASQHEGPIHASASVADLVDGNRIYIGHGRHAGSGEGEADVGSSAGERSGDGTAELDFLSAGGSGGEALLSGHGGRGGEGGTRLTAGEKVRMQMRLLRYVRVVPDLT